MKIKVGIIFGGNSTEHEISIISACQAMENIDYNKYDVVPIYITKDKEWLTGRFLNDLEMFKDMELLKKYSKKVDLVNQNGRFILQSKKLFKREVEEIDIAFPIVHGTSVEDGNLQGFLDTINIPYVGSKVLASSVGQDKVMMKQIYSQNNIPVVDYKYFYDFEYANNKEKIIKEIETIDYPLIVKPSSLGSSIGIAKVNDKKSLEDAIKEAMKYDRKIIVEKAIENMKELNCSVLGNVSYMETSVIEEVSGEDDFLSYNDKYMKNGKKGKFQSKGKGIVSTNRKIPAKVSKKLKEEVENLSKKAFYSLDCSGVARIDLLLDSNEKKLYVNEINIIPGSLSFYLWKENKKEYKDLLDDLIKIAIKEYKESKKKESSFNTNILKNYNKGVGIKK